MILEHIEVTDAAHLARPNVWNTKDASHQKNVLAALNHGGGSGSGAHIRYQHPTFDNEMVETPKMHSILSFINYQNNFHVVSNGWSGSGSTANIRSQTPGLCVHTYGAARPGGPPPWQAWACVVKNCLTRVKGILIRKKYIAQNDVIIRNELPKKD